MSRPRRFNVPREPNGRARRDLTSPSVVRAMAAASMPHRRAVADPVDPMAENELGRMCLRGHITKDQHTAGCRYAEVVAEWRAMVGCPAGLGNAAVSHWGGCRGDETCPEEPCECLRRQKAHQRASKCLQKAGDAATMAVNRVVIDDAVWQFDKRHLATGLAALAVHFGITGRRP